MEKGGKRRVVNLKANNASLSPVRQLRQSSRTINAEQQNNKQGGDSQKISKIRQCKYHFIPGEFEAINLTPFSMRMINFLELIINKSEPNIQNFFENTNPSIQASFKLLKKYLSHRISEIKQQRMKIIENDVVYVRPQKDLFQIEKSKFLNILLQQSQQQYQLKLKFPRLIIEDKQYADKTESIQQKIQKKSKIVTQQIFNQQFQPICQTQYEKRQLFIKQSLNTLRQNLIGLLKATQIAMETKMNTQRIKKISKKQKENQLKNFMKENFEHLKHSRIGMTRIQNCFFE